MYPSDQSGKLFCVLYSLKMKVFKSCKGVFYTNNTLTTSKNFSLIPFKKENVKTILKRVISYNLK